MTDGHGTWRAADAAPHRQHPGAPSGLFPAPAGHPTRSSLPGAEQRSSLPGAEQRSSLPGAEQRSSLPRVEQRSSLPGAEQPAGQPPGHPFAPFPGEAERLGDPSGLFPGRLGASGRPPHAGPPEYPGHPYPGHPYPGQPPAAGPPPQPGTLVRPPSGLFPGQPGRPVYREPHPAHTGPVLAGLAAGAVWFALFGALGRDLASYAWWTIAAAAGAWLVALVLSRIGDRGVAVGVALAGGLGLSIATWFVAGRWITSQDWPLW